MARQDSIDIVGKGVNDKGIGRAHVNGGKQHKVVG